MTNKRIARSVARKYAGLFEAPPKVLEQVFSAAKAGFAKAVVKKVERDIQDLKNLEESNQERVQHFENEKAAVRRWVMTEDFFEDLVAEPYEYKLYQTSRNAYKKGDYFDVEMTIKLSLDPMGSYAVTSYLEAKEFNYDRKTYHRELMRSKEEVIRALDEAETKVMLGEAFVGKKLYPDRYKEYQRLLNRAKQDLDPSWNVKNEIYQDFTGWKYVNKSRKESDRILRDKTLYCYVQTEEGKPKVDGSWYPQIFSIAIHVYPDIVDDVHDYDEDLENIYETCEHEVIHYSQEVLALLKGEEDKLYGLPTKEQPERLRQQNMDSESYLTTEIEYQSWLTNQISSFKRRRVKYDKSLWKQMAMEWTASAGGRKYFDTVIDSSSFFDALKAKKPNLWRKAVKEFMRHYNRP